MQLLSGEMHLKIREQLQLLILELGIIRAPAKIPQLNYSNFNPLLFPKKSKNTACFTVPFVINKSYTIVINCDQPFKYIKLERILHFQIYPSYCC